jgi:putative NADH-flavin reductase
MRTEFRVKLIVFGASRGVGRSLTELALADGHRVTAVVRNPSTVELNHESLEVVAGDVTDADSVQRCLPGHEVAFCTVGADKRGGTTLYSTAARNIAGAMDDQGVRRLVFLSNFGVLGEKGSGARTAAVVFIAKLMLRPTLEDHRRALDELRKHNWEWIAVRPMRLTNGPRTGHYRVALEGLPREGTRISRADLADFMLKQVTSSEYVHRVPAIAY